MAGAVRFLDSLFGGAASFTQTFLVLLFGGVGGLPPALLAVVFSRRRHLQAGFLDARRTIGPPGISGLLNTNGVFSHPAVTPWP